MHEIYPFTYPEIVRRAATVDVIWFNQRRMPIEFIEVENTTDMNNALLKFMNFDGFFSTFRIVSPLARQAEFASKLKHPAFKTLESRIRFTSYDYLSIMHSKSSEVAAYETNW